MTITVYRILAFALLGIGLIALLLYILKKLPKYRLGQLVTSIVSFVLAILCFVLATAPFTYDAEALNQEMRVFTQPLENLSSSTNPFSPSTGTKMVCTTADDYTIFTHDYSVKGREAINAEDVGYIVITRSFDKRAGSHEDGSIAYRRYCEVRIIDVNNYKILTSQRFEGTDPPKDNGNTGEAQYGNYPSKQLILEWIEKKTTA